MDQPRDSVKNATGKGGIKTAASGSKHDTLVGGDGFIPRTVIDSFPAQTRVKPKVPSTAVTMALIDSAKAEVSEMKILISKADSLLSEKKKNLDPDWPADRLLKLEKDIKAAKAQMADSNRRLADLEKKYVGMTSPPEPTSAPPLPATKPTKPETFQQNSGKEAVKQGK